MRTATGARHNQKHILSDSQRSPNGRAHSPMYASAHARTTTIIGPRPRSEPTTTINRRSRGYDKTHDRTLEEFGEEFGERI